MSDLLASNDVVPRDNKWLNPYEYVIRNTQRFIRDRVGLGKLITKLIYEHILISYTSYCLL